MGLSKQPTPSFLNTSSFPPFYIPFFPLNTLSTLRDLHPIDLLPPIYPFPSRAHHPSCIHTSPFLIHSFVPMHTPPTHIHPLHYLHTPFSSYAALLLIHSLHPFYIHTTLLIHPSLPRTCPSYTSSLSPTHIPFLSKRFSCIAVTITNRL